MSETVSAPEPEASGLRAAVEALAASWTHYPLSVAADELRALLAAPEADRATAGEPANDAHVATDPLCVEFDKARGIACEACAEDRDEDVQILRGMRDDA